MLFFGKSFRRSSLWKGVTAGLAGGLVGTWAMSQYQNVWNNIGEKLKEEPESRKKKGAKEGENATVKTASAISQEVLHRDLTKKEKKMAGPLVHYAFGTLVGGFYGGLAEAAPGVSKGSGIPFGTSLWLGADEMALPSLKLSKSPASYPITTHAYGLTSHFVYGFVMNAVRKLIRKRL